MSYSVTQVAEAVKDMLEASSLSGTNTFKRSWKSEVETSAIKDNTLINIYCSEKEAWIKLRKDSILYKFNIQIEIKRKLPAGWNESTIDSYTEFTEEVVDKFTVKCLQSILPAIKCIRATSVPVIIDDALNSNIYASTIEIEFVETQNV